MSGPSSSSSFLHVTASAGSQTTPTGKVKVVAGYALQQKLGSGSFADVYKGIRIQPSQQEPEKDTVAIKAITRNSEKLTPKVLKNLEVEISILRTYRHRNIVCLHDVQKTERHFYLILEYCGGGDVQRLIRNRKAGRLSEGLTRRLMRDLAAGLKFLWGQELIHRDIKPQNLLLTGALPLEEVHDPEKTEEMEERRRLINCPSASFALKIADFGFARHLQTASLAETLCGSPLYMAPEILQHNRYDAKADLWSVGTVLFEMITGRPPFNGENPMDLLRNIQRKGVRLPQDVRVSKECVNLLRLLLNRNPLSRAGFKEFFEACDAFVALGCLGTSVVDEGTCQRQRLDLGTIPENEGAGGNGGGEGPSSSETVSNSNSLVAVTTDLDAPVSPNRTAPCIVSPALGSTPVPQSVASPPSPTPFAKAETEISRYQYQQHRGLTPLVPSPPVSGIPLHAASNVPEPLYLDSRSHESSQKAVSQPFSNELSLRRNDPQANSSTENSFVMVEHSSYQQHSTASTAVVSAGMDSFRPAPTGSDTRYRLAVSPPPPSSYMGVGTPNQNPMVTGGRGDYMVVKGTKGMLSTSPGTGGALMGMLTGRTRLVYDETGDKQLDSQITFAAKMLAAAEDVGRRAITVAHLGDSRVYLAMKLALMNEGGSSLLSTTAMDGIEEAAEEGGRGDHDSGAVTDDSGSTEIMASIRRSSTATDKSMQDAKAVAEEEAEEMPFAVASESPPLLDTGLPTRASPSLNKGVSITSARPTTVKPTPSMIRSHFCEALSCYIKALKMLKSAVGASQRVAKEIDGFCNQRLTTSQIDHVQNLKSRCEVTPSWLGNQFKGVLERADAANFEIGKLPSVQALAERNDTTSAKTVEELIYNHALSLGRDGAVKQLLGQFDAARSCYRSAGLLAETLLMEPRVEGDDRKILEGYVDGFAARITELDQIMLHNQSRMMVGSSSANSTGVSRRLGSAVVGVVGGQQQQQEIPRSLSMGANS